MVYVQFIGLHGPVVALGWSRVRLFAWKMSILTDFSWLTSVPPWTCCDGYLEHEQGRLILGPGAL